MIDEIILGKWEDNIADVPDDSVDCGCFDPPYNMNYQSNHRKVKHDKISDDDNLDWLPGWYREIKRVMKEDGHVYVFCSVHCFEFFKIEGIRAGLPFKNVLVWEKNNHGSGDLEGDYAPKFELILYFSNGKRKLNGKRHPNILKFARTGNELHPTQKPVPLIRFLITKSTDRGQIVLDTHSGSGTTAEACVIEDRRFICMEREPKWHATGVRRVNMAKSQLTLFA